MKIKGYEYRYIHVTDPPTPYGVGLEDPEGEYWLVPPHGDSARVFFRPHLPVENGEPVTPWQELQREKDSEFTEFFSFAEFLANLNWPGILDERIEELANRLDLSLFEIEVETEDELRAILKWLETHTSARWVNGQKPTEFFPKRPVWTGGILGLFLTTRGLTISFGPGCFEKPMLWERFLTLLNKEE